MQVLLAGTFALMAPALRLQAWVVPVLGLLMVASLLGATQDIGTDGVYVTTLDSKDQAVFTGIQSASWNIGYLLVQGPLVMLVGRLAGERLMSAEAHPSPQAYAHAWSLIIGVLAAMAAVMAVWHRFVLPEGAKAQDAPKSVGDAMHTFGDAFVTYFQKKDIWMMLAFTFCFRAGYGMLDKIGPLFLLDPRTSGGLGLNNTMVGTLNGFVGLTAFILGSVLGGLFVARRGLQKSLFILALAMNVPNVTFLYLGVAQPTQIWLIGSVFFIEKLSWGFGAVGLMIYMMQQMAPGPYRTAHYAFSTGLGLNLCMVATGSLSGYLQTRVGYRVYFILALLAAIPSILFTLLAPFNQPTTDEQKED